MLTVISGKDSEKKYKRISEIIGGREHHSYADGETDLSMLISRAKDTPLFGDLLPVVVHTEDKEFLSSLSENAGVFGESATQFIFVVPRILKEEERLFSRAGATSEIFETKEKKESFNIFALSDAFTARDRMKTWILFREAIDRGIDSNLIHGVLASAVKNMRLLFSVGSAEEAGIHPFVYGKLKRNQKHFSEEELSELSKDFVHSYHRARQGTLDFEIELERILISSL